MADCYDTLDNHLGAAPDLARAMIPMGMLLAWAVNQHLVSGRLLEQHERLVLRIRFQEVGGSELLAVCGGDLRRDLFNQDGQLFLDQYYPQYLSDYQELFGGDGYTLTDDLRSYQPLAVMLTQRFMALMRRDLRQTNPPLLHGLRRAWRKLWR